MRRRVGGCVWYLALWAAAAGAQVEEGRDYVVVLPTETWRAPQWPMVLLTLPPGANLAEAARTYGPQAAVRGALLAALEGGDLARVNAVIDRLRASYPVRPDSVLLIGQGEMAAWARQQVLAEPRLFSGLVAIDDPGPDPSLLGAIGRAVSKIRQAACVIVSDAARLAGGKHVHDLLIGHGLAVALRHIEPGQLVEQVGRALTALLPSTPPRTELVDEVTQARLTALPGWQFVRDDLFLAVALPPPGAPTLRVEIAAGSLGQRSFDDYVAATQQALAVDGIEVLGQDDLPSPAPHVRIHAFRFDDHRTDPPHSVYWVQLGYGKSLLSFRAVGDPGQLDSLVDAVRQLALNVVFPTPPAP